MTCKDCIHYEVCGSLGMEVYRWGRKPTLQTLQIFLDKFKAEHCTRFKPSFRFVELPCRVGDKVYFNNVHLRYARVIAIYIDASGGMFDLDITTNIATATGYEHFINKDYTFEDIGRRLFLTREEAEQELKERGVGETEASRSFGKEREWNVLS